ncbi:tetratricopeptide repeat protein [Myxococcota bacterium]|nr:tetratricopeptide repeat protein [Myxococcota bacterium]
MRADAATVSAMRLAEARAALEDGDPQTAIVEAEELLDVDPDNLDALFLVGDASLELGDALGARAAYERYLELCPDDPGALSGLAVACFDLTDLDGCLKAARQAVTLEPQLAEAWHQLGLVYELRGDTKEARQHLRRATELEPESFPSAAPIPQAAWSQALNRALQSLPRRLRAWYAQVPMELLPLPDLDELRRSSPPISPSVLALASGAPPDDAAAAWESPPKALRFFQANLEREATFSEDLVATIRGALVREAAEWLGLSPDDAQLER